MGLGYFLKKYGAKGFYSYFSTLWGETLVKMRIPFPEERRKVFLREGSCDHDIFRQVFLDREYDIPFKIKPKNILDLGAHIGLASVFFSLTYPCSRVVAVEPDNGNYSLLKKNIADFENIIALNAAAWSCDKTLSMHDPGRGNCGFQVEDQASEEGSNRFRVDGLSIETIMEKNDMKFIDILKVDIEGSEKELFRDSPKWINRVGIIAIELHERFMEGCNHYFEKSTGAFNVRWSGGENILVSKQEYLDNQNPLRMRSS